jgi:hypothetical protein
MVEDRNPRTFREVGMLIASVKSDLERVEKKVDRLLSVFIVSIICPIVVAVTVAVIIKNSK